MSWKKHHDDCPGCKPAMLDAKTGRQLPAHAPEMRMMMAVWNKTTREEREAFHRVTCLNSRAPEDIKVIQDITERWKGAMAALAMSRKN